jgi:hypothetical protein
LYRGSILDLKVLNLEFSSKTTFVDRLTDILQGPDFCSDINLDFDCISDLLDKLEDDLSYVLEYPYIDKHYRDSYYCYHSAKFEELARVHNPATLEHEIRNT